MSAIATSGTGGIGSGSKTLTPLVLALLAAALLLMASVMKILDWSAQASAAEGARETIGGDVAGPGILLLVWAIAEIVIAVGIVVFRKRAWLWSLATVMFGVFAGYIFVLMVRGEASCGCFGKFSPPPVVMFSVDTLMAIACATLASRSWGFSGFRGMVLTVAGVGSVAGAVVAAETTEAPVSESFDPIAVLRELSIMKPVMSVDRDAPHYLVYIYNISCPACQAHYPGMKAFTDATADQEGIHGLLLEVNEIQALAEAEGKSLHNSAWGMLPITLVMRNGQVAERFDMTKTPNPGDVYERLTGKSYKELLDGYFVPTAHGPNSNPKAVVHSSTDFLNEKQGLVSALRAVPGVGGVPRFQAIFEDEPGGVRHLLYAHTNCGVCIEYRKEMLELQGMIDDRLVLYPVMADLLVDKGIAVDEWEGVHAALLFDGGELVRWYGEGEVSGDLPLTILDELESH